MIKNKIATPTSHIVRCCSNSLVVLLLSITSTSASDIAIDPILAGKNIYMHGKLSSGKEVLATTVGDVQLSGEQAACVNCHRHSGLGSNEGSTIAPPITGEILFSETKIKAHRYQSSEQAPSKLDRPPYTKNTLQQTLISGIDVAGNPLDAIMPRYAFTEKDFSQLHAYLNSLSIEDAGVTDTTLNIATIIDGRVSVDESDTLLRTLEQYISDLNSKTRREDVRANQAPIQKEWSYQGYRKINLLVWRLSGEPDSWQKQLNNHYDNTPAFAVVSGISKDSWENIDKFCNARAIPCILPNTKTPGYSDKNFYTLYFNAGPFNDASVIARYFHDNAKKNNITENIVQLYDTSSYSKIAKNTLDEALSSDQQYIMSSVSLETTNSNDAIDQYIINKNTTVVIWSDALDTTLIETLSKNKNKIKLIFIPYYLATSIETRKKLENIGIELLTSYPYVKPTSEQRTTLRSSVWARSRKIDMTEKAVFTNTFTAINLLMDAIKHVKSNFNRAYIIELLEHMLDNSVLTGMYPKLTIGPNQRYASRGGYIMKIPEDATLPLQSISEWLLPEKQVKLTQ